MNLTSNQYTHRTKARQAQLKKVAYSQLLNLTSPAAEFFDELSTKDKAKVQRLFDRQADHGRIANPQRCGDPGDGLPV